MTEAQSRGGKWKKGGRKAEDRSVVVGGGGDVDPTVPPVFPLTTLPREPASQHLLRTHIFEDRTKEPNYLEADTEDPFSNMKTKDITYLNTKEQKYQARETKESMYILGAE